MHKIEINRENGNIPKSLAGEDHVTGLIAYMTTAEIPGDFQAEPPPWPYKQQDPQRGPHLQDF